MQDADAAVRAAAEIGFPVVLKIVSPDMPHKTEVGGVKVGLASVDEVRQAFAEMLRSVADKAPQAAIDGVLVAPMAQGGIAELILGTTTDPVFGPVVMVGLGGIFAEIIGDVAVQVAPVDRSHGDGDAAVAEGVPAAGWRARPARPTSRRRRGRSPRCRGLPPRMREPSRRSTSTRCW